MTDIMYLRKFVNFIRMLGQSSYMIRSMVIRDIRSRYMGSYLGFFWSVIHPLTQLLLYYFLFSVVMKMRLGAEYGDTSFAIWLIAGLLPWMFFSELVIRSPGTVLEHSSVIKKMVFPSEILPFVHLTAAMMNHFIGLTILFGFLLVLGYEISLKIIYLFLYMFTIGLFALGISWLLSSLNVFLRDIGQVISVVMNIWFFLTPISYPIHMIPPHANVLLRLNPMLHVVDGYRMALLGKADMDIGGLAYILIVGLVTFVIGGLVFQKLKPAFADVL